MNRYEFNEGEIQVSWLNPCTVIKRRWTEINEDNSFPFNLLFHLLWTQCSLKPPHHGDLRLYQSTHSMLCVWKFWTSTARSEPSDEAIEVYFLILYINLEAKFYMVRCRRCYRISRQPKRSYVPAALIFMTGAFYTRNLSGFSTWVRQWGHIYFGPEIDTDCHTGP